MPKTAIELELQLKFAEEVRQNFLIAFAVAEKNYLKTHPKPSNHAHGKKRVAQLLQETHKPERDPLTELSHFIHNKGKYLEHLLPLPVGPAYQIGKGADSFMIMLCRTLQLDPKMLEDISAENQQKIQRAADFLKTHYQFDIKDIHDYVQHEALAAHGPKATQARKFLLDRFEEALDKHSQIALT